MSECKDCAKYEGDCGLHFKDTRGHILWDVPSESMYDGVIGDTPYCFEPSKEYQEKNDMKLIKTLAEYSIDILKRAIDYKEKQIALSSDEGETDEKEEKDIKA